MFRRVGRPGLIGTVARTAVVAGTATATANAVSKHQATKAAEKQAYADQQAAQAQPQQPQYQEPQYQQPQYQQPQYQQPAPVYQAPPAAPEPAPAAGGEDDLVAQIAQLAKLKEAGVLSDAEFTAAKSKLLGL